MDRYFEISRHGSTVRTEILAGITTFLTMAYIIFVNPSILAEAGMDRGAVFVATCVAAAFGTLMMGLYAKLPIAQAPGMGLNAYFTYGVVLGLPLVGRSWQIALGAVFLSGILFIIISVLPIREQIINAIPRSLKLGISAGIGFFLAIIGMRNAGFVAPHPATMVGLGALTAWTTILAAVGFVAMIALVKLNVRGAIMIAILLVSVVGMITGLTPAPATLVDTPPSLAPTFLQLDILGALHVGLIAIVFAFLFVDLFDTAGTLVGVCHRAGLLDDQGRIPRLRQALLADSSATVVGALLGTSTVTSYIESAAGTNAGGRTGLTAVTVGVLFLLALFFAPLAGSIPAYATAPALIFVACLMARGMTEIDWDDATEYGPAVVCALAMPFTFSIAHGIAFGFITYAAVKLITGRLGEMHPIVGILAVLFCVKFWWLG
ncbi:MAG: NCS2 family permease [Alphaproteobacteria bacterium]|nr:NCS2 family permease [Alphaproteobacteria bacterium]